VEFGTGFNAADFKGSQNNDPYVIRDGHIVTTTNNAGGILGGITSGMPLVARLAFKPTPSIKKEQQTVNIKDMSATSIRIEGRHDGCIVPRAVVVAEAMMCTVLCDMALRAGALPGVIK
jgi:chorismate synthase